MSSRDASPAAPGNGRHRLLLTIETWRRTRIFLIYMVVMMVAAELVTSVELHRLDPVYLVAALILLGLLGGVYWRQRAHYVELGAEGLLLRSDFRSAELPYRELRQARCQSVRVFMDSSSRRDLLRGGLRRYADNSVCILRVDREPEEVARLGRLVGRRTVSGQDVVLLVERAEDLERALQTRIRRRPPTASSRGSRRR